MCYVACQEAAFTAPWLPTEQLLRLFDVDCVHATTLGIFLGVKGDLVSLDTLVLILSNESVKSYWICDLISVKEKILRTTLYCDESEIFSFHLLLDVSCVHIVVVLVYRAITQGEARRVFIGAIFLVSIVQLFQLSVYTTTTRVRVPHQCEFAQQIPARDLRVSWLPDIR